MTNSEYVNIYASELIDRSLRFYLHLKTVENEFYQTSQTLDAVAVSKDKPEFLNSFRQCIITSLTTARSILKECASDISVEKRDALMSLIRHGFLSIRSLHEDGLVHLPRPSEPVELRRFCRIISKHVLKRKISDLSVYIGEATTDGAFVADPLGQVKQEQFSRMAAMANALCTNQVISPEVTGKSGIHITIARIDARNPVHWPTIMHEAGHKLLTPEIIGAANLNDKLISWAHAGSCDINDTTEIDLNSWLTEIWCDLFGALVIGPAFFFSQFSCFVAMPNDDDKNLNQKYPPHGFRLRLIGLFLKHRYEIVKSDPLRSPMQECQTLIDYWDEQAGLGLGEHDKLKELFEVLRAFFQEHFFSGTASDSENFQTKYESMLRYVRAIDVNGLKKIQDAISEGLPASSKRLPDSRSLKEEPTSLQEVLLAASLNRVNYLRPHISKQLAACSDVDVPSYIDSDIIPLIERIDNAILRSLQIGEWLHVLSSTASSEVVFPQTNQSQLKSLRVSGKSVLVDFDILALLTEGELCVLPLVDADQQLGSTSLDIRLGTSFEVFLPACRYSADSAGQIDEAYESQRIDLDFLEHVVLLPGQFMLAHSFEYLKLPDWLAADMDGRSSYARLGLEVHMTAGMIDPGFEGVVTFELFNAGPNPIRLFPGLRIAQLRFTSVGNSWRPYGKRNIAKYRGLLQHNRSLYMNDVDFKKIAQAVKDYTSIGK